MARAARTGPDGGPVVVRVAVTGVVQGVGFRPFVWRLASELGLRGSVRNAAGRVEIDVVGEEVALATLIERLRSQAPPRARVEAVSTEPLTGAAGSAARAASGFAIDASVSGGEAARLFPPDIATCEACLAEVADPKDRRHRYPFTNCTDCGPRATIIDDLPYDRAATTMRVFALCAACAAEYSDPADRRFHAEPVACPDCGPRLSYRPARSPKAEAFGEAALARAVADLRAGAVVAVKGLGGYHLACDATDEDAVALLRERKRRWAKPFAVMVADLAEAGRLARVDETERSLLAGPGAPVVLLAARPEAAASLAPSVAAGSPNLGLFLPYTPLHHLLLQDLGRPVVLTSGNLSDEPLATDDDDAARRLAPLAEAFLGHDRRIRARYDDSVTRVVAGRESIVRRARGYAPEAVPLPVATPRPLLAVGAELKHTFTLARGANAHVAPHNGDLEDLATFEAFTDGLAHLSRLLALDPDVVVHDLHPEYLSTKHATRTYPAERRIAVQHHHAHVASCAAEHGVTGPFLGVAYDGLGMGDDGTFWGGEVLLADLSGYRRLARFGRAPMPGGALAVRRPYRMALGYLLGAEDVPGGPGVSPDSDPGSRSRAGPSGGIPLELAESFFERLDERELATVRTQVSRGLNAPVASSAGRLFDAVAALLGLRDVAEFEAQAAIDLEVAAGAEAAEPLPYRLARLDGLLVYDPRVTLRALLEASSRGTAREVLAAAFHECVVEVTRELLRDAAGLSRVVCLSGGVLQNRRLATTLLDRLTADGFEVFINRLVPCNDGGISYGQAAVAASRMAAAAGPGSPTPAVRV